MPHITPGGTHERKRKRAGATRPSGPPEPRGQVINVTVTPGRVKGGAGVSRSRLLMEMLTPKTGSFSAAEFGLPKRPMAVERIVRSGHHERLRAAAQEASTDLGEDVSELSDEAFLDRLCR